MREAVERASRQALERLMLQWLVQPRL